MRLLLLFVTQTPPQGRKLEAPPFFAETTSSTSVFVTPPMKTPLKQFWGETSFFTTDFSSGSAVVPMSAMPWRFIRWTTPSPSIRSSSRLLWMPSASLVGNSLSLTQPVRGSSFAVPVILKLRLSLIPERPKLMHGWLSSCKHSMSHVSVLFSVISQCCGDDPADVTLSRIPPRCDAAEGRCATVAPKVRRAPRAASSDASLSSLYASSALAAREPGPRIPSADEAAAGGSLGTGEPPKALTPSSGTLTTSGGNSNEAADPPAGSPLIAPREVSRR